jgi:hypothetical protein
MYYSIRILIVAAIDFLRNVWSLILLIFLRIIIYFIIIWFATKEIWNINYNFIY